jgi:hypothetical protein
VPRTRANVPYSAAASKYGYRRNFTREAVL